jgi:hypothetical protein
MKSGRFFAELKRRNAGMPSLLVDSVLRDLRDDPRYKSVLAKLGLPTTS